MDVPGSPAVLSGFEAVEEPVQQLATTEGRLVTTAVVLVVALSVTLAVLPAALRATSSVVRGRVLPDGVVEILDILNAALPTTVTGVTLRGLQATILGTATVALFVTWGMVDAAVTVVDLLWTSLPFAGQFLLTLVVLALAYVAADSLQSGVREFSDETERITAHQEEIMLRVGHLAVMLVVASGLFTLWGFNLSGLLVGAGALSVIIGLAARQTLGSMVAGLVLMFTRPFTVGDWVQIGDYEGTVTHITVMHTKLQEFDGRQVTIPNDSVSNQPIRNLSYQEVLRLQTEVGVDYDADPAHAEQVALAAVESADTVVDGPPPEATATTFGDSAVVLELLYWIDDPNPLDARRARRDVVHSVKERFEAEDIGMPFPTRTLQRRDESDARVIPEPAAGEPRADGSD
jgi:small-conductance mechanosensitive channel